MWHAELMMWCLLPDPRPPIEQLMEFNCYTGKLNDPVPQDYTRDIPDF